MRRNVKTAAGISLASVLGLTVHVIHLYHTTTQQANDFPSFEKANATIILTDSTGRKDTMLLEDYLKLQEEQKRELYQNSLNNEHFQEGSKQLRIRQ